MGAPVQVHRPVSVSGGVEYFIGLRRRRHCCAAGNCNLGVGSGVQPFNVSGRTEFFVGKPNNISPGLVYYLFEIFPWRVGNNKLSAHYICYECLLRYCRGTV